MCKKMMTFVMICVLTFDYGCSGALCAISLLAGNFVIALAFAILCLLFNLCIHDFVR